MRLAAAVTGIIAAAALLLYYTHGGPPVGEADQSTTCFYYEGIPPVLPTWPPYIHGALYIYGERVAYVEWVSSSYITDNGTVLVMLPSPYDDVIVDPDTGFVASRDYMGRLVLDPVRIVSSGYVPNKIYVVWTGNYTQAYFRGVLCLPYDALVYFPPEVRVWHGGG